MKDFILNWVLRLLTEYLTKERVQEWADKAKNFAVPWIRDLKDKLIAGLHAKAQETENDLDDDMVQDLDDFLDAFLPDNPKTL